MIGNDLVDLAQAAGESNWKRRGYLDKICHTREQRLIFGDQQPDRMLWLIWTMKEAVYKIVSRKAQLREYRPLAFTCSPMVINAHGATGTVSYGNDTYFIRSSTNNDRIHTLAAAVEEQMDRVQFCYLSNTKVYRQQFNETYPDFHLRKHPSGLPELIHTATGNSHAVSLSHHGRFLAIAYSVSPLSAD